MLAVTLAAVTPHLPDWARTARPVRALQVNPSATLLHFKSSAAALGGASCTQASAGALRPDRRLAHGGSGEGWAATVPGSETICSSGNLQDTTHTGTVR